MFESIDNYCERVGSGFFAEPFNAATNLAFILTAFYGWRLTLRLRQQGADSYFLLACVISIGVGSGLFHTFANGWTMLADIIPIVVFQATYLWLYCLRVVQLRWYIALPVMALFFCVASAGFHLSSLGLVSEVFLSKLNGSGMYAGALLGVLALGLYHFLSGQSQRHILLYAALVFALSLVFRTLDMALCDDNPLGTHFLWHLGNAVVMYLSLVGYLYNKK